MSMTVIMISIGLNKPKMAYSRNLLKMARQQCSVALWIEIAVILNWK